jgi:hypothetical protein
MQGPPSNSAKTPLRVRGRRAAALLVRRRERGRIGGALGLLLVVHCDHVAAAPAGSCSAGTAQPTDGASERVFARCPLATHERGLALRRHRHRQLDGDPHDRSREMRSRAPAESEARSSPNAGLRSRRAESRRCPCTVPASLGVGGLPGPPPSGSRASPTESSGREADGNRSRSTRRAHQLAPIRVVAAGLSRSIMASV